MPHGDADGKADNPEGLGLQLAGFLSSLTVLCFGLYYHLKEVVQGGGEGPHGNPVSYSEAGLRYAFKILGPKQRPVLPCTTWFPKHSSRRPLPVCFA